MSAKANTKYILLILFLISTCFTFAQLKVSDIRVVVQDVRVENDSVRAILDMEIIGMSVAAREQIYLFPVIKSGMREKPMPPVIINGSIQQAVENRLEKLSGKRTEAYAIYTIKGEKIFHTRMSYDASIPYEEWMESAQVGIAHERRNCRCEFHRVSMEIIANRIRTAKASSQEGYILPVKIPVPPREEIKHRSETGEALIIYKVGNAEINPMLGNNQYELDKIRNSIEEIRYVSGVTIHSIEIDAYASPEGNWNNNYLLSERRAASLIRWIQTYHNLGYAQLRSRGYGEDWTGLAEYIKTDLMIPAYEKDALLRIIQYTDINTRKNELMKYNGGMAYRYLLNSIYPKLRRSVYRIKFTVPEYNIQTIKEMYNTNPGMLSLHEFYLLANLYDPDSNQYRSILNKAIQLYPNDKFSRIFKALFSYRSDDPETALTYLAGLEDEPEAWLYLAAVYAKMNNLDKAEEYARKAQQAGNAEAVNYLRLIREYKEAEK